MVIRLSEPQRTASFKGLEGEFQSSTLESEVEF